MKNERFLAAGEEVWILTHVFGPRYVKAKVLSITIYDDQLTMHDSDHLLPDEAWYKLDDGSGYTRIRSRKTILTDVEHHESRGTILANHMSI